MLFKPEHIPMILNGTKTATRRDWKKPMVKVGNDYPVKTQMLSKETHCRIKVLKIYKQKLRYMNDKDAFKEGYYFKDFVEIWKKINGKWDGDLEVYVIEFKLLRGTKHST